MRLVQAAVVAACVLTGSPSASTQQLRDANLTGRVLDLPEAQAEGSKGEDLVLLLSVQDVSHGQRGYPPRSCQIVVSDLSATRDLTGPSL